MENMKILRFPNSLGQNSEREEQTTTFDRNRNRIKAKDRVKSYRVFGKNEYQFNHNTVFNQIISEELFAGNFIIKRIVDLFEFDVKVSDGLENRKVPCLILKYSGKKNYSVFANQRSQTSLKLQEDEIAVVASDIVLFR